MRLSRVLISTSIIVILGGIWVAIVPFVGPYVMGTAMMMNSMTVVTASTYVYHIVPGAIIGLVGIFQLVAGLQRRERPVSTKTTEQSVQRA
jgi:uncharacterized membrane protein YuzA (DUF378 family)